MDGDDEPVEEDVELEKTKMIVSFPIRDGMATRVKEVVYLRNDENRILPSLRRCTTSQ